MSNSSVALHPLDHLVLPVDGLAPARARLSRLGFTVAPDARHPFGTENACVFFADNTYLEPLAVGDQAECEAAAAGGNVFVARDQAFRADKRNAEGLSAMVAGTPDAAADQTRFVKAGIKAGEMLSFERPVKMADGRETVAGFRLAFAADAGSPDFFLFACERVNPLPADRGALARHDNGVVGIATVVLCADQPTDFQALLEAVFVGSHVVPCTEGLTISTANAAIEVLTPQGLETRFGLATGQAAAGLQGAGVVFRVADLQVTETVLAANGVPYSKAGNRLLVQQAPGQGVPFLFQEP
ncbi:MAG: VOC family protein [Allorhizobium sp.]